MQAFRQLLGLAVSAQLLLPPPKSAGEENTNLFIRAAPILPAFPPLEYAQGGDNDPDDGYYKPAIAYNIGFALVSFAQMRQRRRIGRDWVAVGAGGNR